METKLKTRAEKAAATKKQNKLDAVYNGRDILCYRIRKEKKSGIEYISRGGYLTFSEDYISFIRRLVGGEDKRQEIMALDLDGKTPEQVSRIAKKYRLQTAELQQIQENTLLQSLPADIKRVGTCYT